jgi:predicted transcriptional regulator of viral defense system
MPRTWTSDVVDQLLAHGRTSVTTDEAAALLGVPADHVRVRMQPLVHSGMVFSPARGLWVAVPPEYRTWKVTPGLNFIDTMMSHLGRDYYVGWLSAAELHGAAHQRPQVLQVAVDRRVRDRDIGRVRMRFAERTGLRDLPRQQRNVPTGQAWVSTPEVTVFDLAADPDLGGGISNVATVVAELAEEAALDQQRLVEASEHFSLATVRRLGYLLDAVEASSVADALRPVVASRHHFPPDLLSPAGPDVGDLDPGWRVRVNTEVEPDL